MRGVCSSARKFRHQFVADYLQHLPELFYVLFRKPLENLGNDYVLL